MRFWRTAQRLARFFTRIRSSARSPSPFPTSGIVSGGGGLLLSRPLARHALPGQPESSRDLRHWSRLDLSASAFSSCPIPWTDIPQSSATGRSPARPASAALSMRQRFESRESVSCACPDPERMIVGAEPMGCLQCREWSPAGSVHSERIPISRADSADSRPRLVSWVREPKRVVSDTAVTQTLRLSPATRCHSNDWSQFHLAGPIGFQSRRVA